MRIALMLVLVLGCGKDEKKHSDHESMDDMVAEASVDWARKQLPEIDKKLASTDPGSASSVCAVIKPDMKKIEKADPELATQVKQKCLHDYPLRELAVAIDKAEAARAAQPTGYVSECSRVTVDIKGLDKQGLVAEAAALITRGEATCPKR
jgi:hypothetical protein